MEALVGLVSSAGLERERATAIAEYVTDRCAGLSVASVHSSTHSSLRRDTFLRQNMALSSRQIGAWVALIRGTRAVRRRSDGRVVGGQPGLIEVMARGQLNQEHLRRFQRLARVAAVGTPRSAADRGSSLIRSARPMVELDHHPQSAGQPYEEVHALLEASRSICKLSR